MSISGRTRTPSDVKWLLVERAYLVGELQQLEETRRRLAERLTQLTRRRDRLEVLAQAAEKTYTAKAQALNALERVGTMLVPSTSLNGETKPVLKRNMFGRLGALRDFLESELRACSPAHLSTSQLVDKTLVVFNIEAYAPEIRRAVRRTVASTLLRMSKQGLVTAVPSTASGDATEWRLNRGSVLSLMEQMALLGALNEAPTA